MVHQHAIARAENQAQQLQGDQEAGDGPHRPLDGHQTVSQAQAHPVRVHNWPAGPRRGYGCEADGGFDVAIRHRRFRFPVRAVQGLHVLGV